MRLKLKGVILMLVSCWLSVRVVAQYELNPMSGLTWHNAGVGVSAADFQSGQFNYLRSFRSETVLSVNRLSINRELGNNPNDTISNANTTIELALMFGECWQGKRKPWWIATAVGMSLNNRRYWDFVPQSETEVELNNKFTMGIPGHLEVGWMFSKKWGVAVSGNANWNFREAWWGGGIGVVYRMKKKA
jgi:hypothetical protein